jgi:hypothetical protein
VGGFQDSRELILLVLSGAAGPILFIGVAFPAMYLYAMHRLLFMLRAQKKTSSDNGEHKDDKQEPAT